MISKIIDSVRSVLTADLLTKRWREQTVPSSGHCYVAAEACYHLLGGKSAGWIPQVARCEDDGTHWWLKHVDGTICDPTWDQFDEPFDYVVGRGSGFLTKGPSKRARIIMDRVKKLTTDVNPL